MEDRLSNNEVTRILCRRCTNCYHDLPGYNVKGKGWNWLTPNVGPFCDVCWKEIESTKDLPQVV